MRLVIFGLLGPIVGMLALLGFGAVMFANVPPLGGALALLVPAYVMGLMPALLVGAFDWAIARRTGPVVRAVLSAAVGGLVCFLPLATSILSGFMPGPAVPLFGITGLSAGLVCSLLSTLWERMTRQLQSAG